MKWLLFCYYNAVRCGGTQYVPKGFNKSRHFGYEFSWHEINGWPRMIEDRRHSEALHIEIGRFHSPFASFIAAEPEEIAFIPQANALEITLSELGQVIGARNAHLLMVGIESSPAHVPKTYRKSIECQIYKLIERTAFHGNGGHRRKHGFVRLIKMENDHTVPYPLCSI